MAEIERIQKSHGERSDRLQPDAAVIIAIGTDLEWASIHKDLAELQPWLEQAKLYSSHHGSLKMAIRIDHSFRSAAPVDAFDPTLCFLKT